MKIGIIGAGPAGMCAALQAAWHGQQVTLFDKNPMVGRKLLVTGSGRCNLTNDGVNAQRYTCADLAWMEAALSQFSQQNLLDLFREIGVLTMKTADGWYYPLSESAQTVADAFFAALKSAGVSMQMHTQVTHFEQKQGGFKLQTMDGEASFDRLVVAAGGKAYPKLGSTGELFPVLAKLGHTIIPKRPALAPVQLALGELRALIGLRFDAGVKVMSADQVEAESAGNLILTEWGMNGPAVMDISHVLSKDSKNQRQLSINFLHFHKMEFAGYLAEKRQTDLPIRNLLGAFFPPKVSSFFLRLAGVNESTPMQMVSEADLNRLINLLRDYRLPVEGVRGFEYCQVSAGGTPVTEVDPLTMESKRVYGLYLVGETLDVVGPCGGYNLHHAFISGAIAGMALGA